MGLPDRIIRIALATIAPILYVTDNVSGIFAVVLLGISGFLLLTSFIKFCPLYIPFGINTEQKI